MWEKIVRKLKEILLRKSVVKRYKNSFNSNLYEPTATNIQPRFQIIINLEW